MSYTCVHPHLAWLDQSSYIPSLHYPSVQLLEPWYSKFNRRLLKGYAIHLLLSPCRKNHTQKHKTKNKTWQIISTYKNKRGECFLIKGRLSARRAFSYKATLAEESTNELFPPSPFMLPTGLPPEHTGNHSTSCLTIPVSLNSKQCASEDNVRSRTDYLSPGKLSVLWKTDVLFPIKKSLFSHHWDHTCDPLILVKFSCSSFKLRRRINQAWKSMNSKKKKKISLQN